VLDDVKTGDPYLSRDKTGRNLSTASWHPVYRRHERVSGSCREREKLVSDEKGKGTSGDPARLKVPMRLPVADYFVVVMKRSNVRGAKGVGYPRCDRCANGKPEERRGFNGGR
jgi:hypothetical protein